MPASHTLDNLHIFCSHQKKKAFHYLTWDCSSALAGRSDEVCWQGLCTNRAALSPNSGVFTCSMESRWWKRHTPFTQLAVFADPVRACSAVDTLTDKSGECRTRIERARQESGCRPNVAVCCVLRRPSVACHADARHGVHENSANQCVRLTTWVVFFFFGAGA